MIKQDILISVLLLYNTFYTLLKSCIFKSSLLTVRPYCTALLNHWCIIGGLTWWRHQIYFPRYWPFVRGITRSPVNSPHKDQWHGALLSSLISAWTNDYVNNIDAGDLRCHRIYHDVTVIRSLQIRLVTDTCSIHSCRRPPICWNYGRKL